MSVRPIHFLPSPAKINAKCCPDGPMNKRNSQPTSPSGRQIARGAAWLMLFKITDKTVGLVSTLILARLLTPADFGLVAMASSVVALTELMGAFGFDTALIQRQDARREHYDTAWTFNVIFGMSIALLLIVLADPAADFYHESRLTLILPTLALGALISGFENIGTVAFRKELDFQSEFYFLLAKRITTFVVTIGLAISFRSYWALIAGMVTGRSMSVLIGYRLHPYRPRLDLSARADLFHFSKWLFISNLIQFLHSRSTDFILGRTVGGHGLGIYNVATEIATMPSTELIAPLNRAVYPVYSRLALDPDQLRKRFMEVFGMISLIAFPVAIGLFSIAGLIVRVLLGDQWLEAIPIVQIVATCGLVGALQSNLYVLIVALGKPKANTMLSALLLIVSLPVTIFASLSFGTIGAAYAHLGTALLGLVGIFVIFTKIARISVQMFAAVLWRPVLATAVMALVLPWTEVHLASGAIQSSAALQLIAQVFTGATIYAICVFLLWIAIGRPVSAERSILMAAAERLGR